MTIDLDPLRRDAVLTITFSGVGEIRGQRVDGWLAELLLDRGASELSAAEVVEVIRRGATELFRSFTLSNEFTAHSFSIAGFVGDEQVASYWAVTASRVRARREGTVTFAVTHSTDSPRLFIGGLKDAVREEEIARLRALNTSGATITNVERAFVRLIRDSARDPKWGWGIGPNCTAVMMTAEGTTMVTHYPIRGNATIVGPEVLRHQEGFNWSARVLEAHLGIDYGIKFGTSPITLIGSGRRSHYPAEPPSRVAGQPPALLGRGGSRYLKERNAVRLTSAAKPIQVDLTPCRQISAGSRPRRQP